MWLDNASREAVSQFWQRCGESEPFPRSLERSVALALPVAIIKLPRLMLGDIENWLARRARPFSFNCRSRAVRGCLVAFGGQGFIFVDGADPDDERRFTVAHEAGHFIVDYWLLREAAIEKFGGCITEVFDGLRRPGVTERVHAVLADTRLGVYTKLMERDGGGDAGVWEVEDRADRVALALLAPPEEVLSSADTSAATFAERQAALTLALCERFGLPASAAPAYAASLLESVDRGPSWAESLRLG
ncbi:MAG TPA: hypothetical protein VF546_19010 [Pyrinomonadaceae bacterium]|jgi:hypothetical protein